ncbi:MAG: CHAT domain-containing protein [Proteobacteria bacterium]|nr:CHAT domain-containing protein [Pseudomonadota bacterium]
MLDLAKTVLACLLIYSASLAHADEQWDKLNEQMMMAYEYGDSSSAIEIGRQLLAYSRENLGENHPDTLTSINSLAYLYDEYGLYAEAEPLYQAALTQRQQVLGNDHPDTLDSLGNLAYLYDSQGRYYEAEPLYQQFLVQSKELLGEDHPTTVTILDRLATLYFRQGRYEDAEVLYLSVLEQRQRVLDEDDPNVLLSLNNLANLYDSQGRYKEAEPLYQSVLAKSRQALGEEHPYTSTTLNNLAALYAHQGRYTEAEALLAKTLKKRRAVLGDNHPDTILSMNNLATLYLRQGRYAEAEPLYLSALEQARQTLGGEHATTLLIVFNTADLYSSQGRYAQAEPLAQETLVKRQLVLGEDHPSTLESLNSLAILYQSQGRYSEAETLFQDALRKREVVLGEDHPDTLTSLANLADLYKTQERYEKAEPMYQSVVRRGRRALGENHPITLASLYHLAGLYELQNNFEKAETLYQLVLPRSREVFGDSHPYTLATLFSMAMLQQANGRFSTSLGYWAQYFEGSNQWLASNIWGASEDTRKIYIAREKVSRDNLFSLTVRFNNPDSRRQALDFSLARKGLLLHVSSQITNIAKASSDPHVSDRLSQIYVNKGALAALLTKSPDENRQHRVFELEKRIARLQAELGQSIQALGKSQAEVKFGDLLAGLADDESLVDFHVYENLDQETGEGKTDKLLAIIANNQIKGEMRVIDLGAVEPILHQITEYREMTQRGTNSESLIQASHKLYRQLWQPLTPFLNNIEHVYISPDGVLNLLPFAVLRDGEGRMLSQAYKLSTIASPRDIVLKPPGGTAGNPTVFSGPLYDKSQKQQYAMVEKQDAAVTYSRSMKDLYFSALPGALAEGETVVELFKQEKMVAEHYYLESATEEQLKNTRSPKILHLATHGFFLAPQEMLEKRDSRGAKLVSSTVKTKDPMRLEGGSYYQNPLLRSGIALANANQRVTSTAKINENDGILTALEAMSLYLEGTDLVVLSACETGVGEINVGEGVYGLQRSFLEAGAKAVLYTLWPVSDEGTRFFMERFYQNYLNGRQPQAALQMTQREFMEHQRWSAPYYWAGFVVSGKDWSNGDR